MNTAVLLIVFNRPEYTDEMLDVLALVRPKDIYISADGPRESVNGEEHLCAMVRNKLMNGITWNCKIHTNFMEDNLGCKNGVIRALDWFFAYEQRGIILEDDCIPNPSFFKFAQQLLEKYNHEDRVWMISGDNSANIQFDGHYSYTFIEDPIIWGWATWKRTWQKYDRDMKGWRNIRGKQKAKKIFINNDQYQQLADDYDKCLRGEIDTWDYQLSASMKIEKGLCIIPRVNMIKNVGFGENATHTTTRSERSNITASPLETIIEAPTITTNKAANLQILEKVQGISATESFLTRLKKKLKYILPW